MKAPGPTMQQIADAAGVSKATVSMCFSNAPEISAATRGRVLAIARKLKYRPHPYISALMQHRRRRKSSLDRPVIALVSADATADGWKKSLSATIRQMYAGAQQRAEASGYQAQPFWLHQNSMSNERFSEMLRARGIQGLLLGPLPDHSPAPSLNWSYFSAVGLGVPSTTLTLPMACNDHYFSSFRAVDRCHRLGYRRPGLVLRKTHHDRFHGRWESGFSAAQAALPDIVRTRPLFVDGWDALDEFAAWLDREKPDVILALGTDHVERYLHQLGRAVPHDVGLVGLSCPAFGGRLSGIYQNGHLTGASAMDLLIGMMARNERGLPEQAITLMIEGLWNPGQTVRADASHGETPRQRRRT